MLVPVVAQLGCHPDLTGDTRSADAGTDLDFVAIGKGSVDETISGAESGLDGRTDLRGVGSPGSNPNSGNLGTSVENEGSAVLEVISWLF